MELAPPLPAAPSSNGPPAAAAPAKGEEGVEDAWRSSRCKDPPAAIAAAMLLALLLLPASRPPDAACASAAAGCGELLGSMGPAAAAKRGLNWPDALEAREASAGTNARVHNCQGTKARQPALVLRPKATAQKLLPS